MISIDESRCTLCNLCIPVCVTVGYPDVEFLRVVARNPVNVKWLGDK
jgi:Fe-S-cluster-containing hydrogenase component 2